MNKVAKLVIVDNQGKYLLMHRSEHPRFGTDPDLPGGTLEGSEEPIQTMLREVLEEAYGV
jgi:8-oxo-dGTP pyrophosphatase MutT (NUDIX family)